MYIYIHIYIYIQYELSCQNPSNYFATFGHLALQYVKEVFF